jgi:hypothetical protein
VVVGFFVLYEKAEIPINTEKILTGKEWHQEKEIITERKKQDPQENPETDRHAEKMSS